MAENTNIENNVEAETNTALWVINHADSQQTETAGPHQSAAATTAISIPITNTTVTVGDDESECASVGTKKEPNRITENASGVENHLSSKYTNGLSGERKPVKKAEGKQMVVWYLVGNRHALHYLPLLHTTAK